MRLPNTKQFPYNGLVGYQVELVSGDVAPDGDALVNDVDFKNLPVGSTYWRKVTANQVEQVLKVKDDGRDDDYEVLRGIIKQRLTKADFTDGGSTSGTKDLNATIPAGVIVHQSFITNVTAFSGDTTATVTIGDGTDVDRYNTGTPSVFSTDTSVSAGAVSGTAYHDAAISTVRVTMTSTADFTNVASSGAMTVSIHYYGSRV